MWFWNFRVKKTLHRYLDARDSYCEWRDRYIVDSARTRTAQSVGMEEARNDMQNALSYLRAIYYVPEDEWVELKDGTVFKIYSDPKNSIERRLYVKNN